MIEMIDYGLQFVVLLVCGIYAAVRADRTRSRGWLILSFFLLCQSLGDLYWLLCVAFEGSTPQITFISEISWYASYMFLCLLLRDLEPPGAPARKWQAWCAPAISAAACLFFFQWGDYASNVITAALMGRLGYLALRGLLEGKGGKKQCLYQACLLFFLTEYALWVSSCFWLGDTLANPYFWFDGLLTLTAVLIVQAYKKAVAD